MRRLAQQFDRLLAKGFGGRRTRGWGTKPGFHAVLLLSGLIIWLTGACKGMTRSDSNESLAQARSGLIEELRLEGIRDPRVLEAIAKVRREEFVLPHDRDRAYENRALAIERGQTISQPLIVAMMTELLSLKGEEKILEVGTGSGYQAAVLSLLCREVYSVEIDPLLADQARERLERLGYSNVHVRAGDGFYGWPEAAPFDGIIITAVAPRVPEPLLEQLKPDGVIVMPLEEGWGETLVRVRKKPDGSVETERFGAVAFVPMRGAIRAKEPTH